MIGFLRRKATSEPVDEKAFETCYRQAVADVVGRQAEIGIDIVSDGEFGKAINWARYVLERMSGFERRSRPTELAMPTSVTGRDRKQFAEFYAEYDKTTDFGAVYDWVVTGPITYTGQKAIEYDLAVFKAALAKVQVVAGFVPAVSPASVAPDRKHEYYKSASESEEAIAKALRAEYKAVIDGGLILQLDDSYFASTYDVLPSLQEYRTWASKQVEYINYALEGIPADTARFHVCWGSWNGPHVSDVELKDIVDLILKIRVGGYSIEMANPRHEHEWRIWENTKLPEGKTLVPGVISHATNVVEHPELVAERIVRLANLVGRENVIASSDCGFAQGPFTRRVHPSIQWAKLQSLAQGAELASKNLWGRR